MLEPGLVALLNSDSTVSSLCSARIYPLLLPDSPVLPSVTYQTISSVSQYSNDGATGFTINRIQIDVWGSGYLSVKTLSEAIRSVLEDYTGVLSDGTQVLNIMRANVTDLYENQAYLYRVQTDWLVQFAQQ
jgi:hypothetical protein